MAAASPKIKLYTHPLSPCKLVPASAYRFRVDHRSITGSHRAHITLDELKVPYKQEIVDITKPRTPEYLKMNPRGLVPTLSYDGEIITESSIIATFLADVFS